MKKRRVVSLHYQGGRGLIPTATVQVEVEGEIYGDTAIAEQGQGPQHAIWNAIKRALQIEGELFQWSARSFIEGEQEVMTTQVVLRIIGGKFLTEESSGPDPFECGAYACVKALDLDEDTKTKTSHENAALNQENTWYYNRHGVDER